MAMMQLPVIKPASKGRHGLTASWNNISRWFDIRLTVLVQATAQVSGVVGEEALVVQRVGQQLRGGAHIHRLPVRKLVLHRPGLQIASSLQLEDIQGHVEMVLQSVCFALLCMAKPRTCEMRSSDCSELAWLEWCPCEILFTPAASCAAPSHLPACLPWRLQRLALCESGQRNTLEISPKCAGVLHRHRNYPECRCAVHASSNCTQSAHMVMSFEHSRVRML